MMAVMVILMLRARGWGLGLRRGGRLVPDLRMHRRHKPAELMGLAEQFRAHRTAEKGHRRAARHGRGWNIRGGLAVGEVAWRKPLMRRGIEIANIALVDPSQISRIGMVGRIKMAIRYWRRG
jgi:hypothetical protein